MELKRLLHCFTVCKLKSADSLACDKEFYFSGITDEEVSLLCKTEDAPCDTLEREDGWKGFRIEGTLDFSLIGILSKISAVLAENGISLFAVSTFNTDYIFVREESFASAIAALSENGYIIR